MKSAVSTLTILQTIYQGYTVHTAIAVQYVLARAIHLEDKLIQERSCTGGFPTCVFALELKQSEHDNSLWQR